MKYEIKRSGSDPFDIMCGDCPEHTIEWWEEATLEDLHNAHEEELAADASMPDCVVEDLDYRGLWNPAPTDFDEWLKQSIASGYVRVAA